MSKTKLNALIVVVVGVLGFAGGWFGNGFAVGKSWGVIQEKVMRISEAVASEQSDNKEIHPLVIRHEEVIKGLRSDVTEVKQDVKELLRRQTK